MGKLILVILLGLSLSGFSQQQAQFSMYRFNPLNFNPAYAGSRDALSITALGRKQWVKLDGAPTTGTLSVHTPLKNEKINLGFSFSYDKIGSTKNNSIYGDIAYRTKINDNTRISLGVKGGVDIFSINYSSLDVFDQDDYIFTSPISNEILPNFGFGIYVDNRDWFVGLTAPKLLQSTIESEVLAGNGYRQLNHYYLMGGYTIKLKSYFDLIPMVNIKVAPNSPISTDINLNGLFYESFWIGIGWRVGDAITTNLMYEFSDKFRIGYAYDMTTSKLSSYNNGSHEIMINYDLNTSLKGMRTPRKF